jgi:A/G-specific adenine glycosylase
MNRILRTINQKETGIKLIDWYLENHRELPWRRTGDPYLIWVSEVILQQTRVEQGLGYFNRFTTLFPDIYTLAAAHPDEVMKAWQGLGYYSRARNLHEAARDVVENLGGKIPSTYTGLLKIKGIGPYIAAAIASFAFNEKVAVVDGNVIRFISRLAGIYSGDRKIFLVLASEMMDPGNPCLFNQAIMEFGALQCIPGIPHCSGCLFSEKCYAFNHGAVSSLPIKKKRPDRRNRYFNYFVIMKPGGLVMKKRDEPDIWKGLYDFPMIETRTPASIKKLRHNPSWMDMFDTYEPLIYTRTKVFRHVLSHQVIHARFYLINDTDGQTRTDNNYSEVSVEKVPTIPVPRLLENFMKNTDWLNHQI